MTTQARSVTPPERRYRDPLSQLLQFSWKGIAFPVQSMEVDVEHALPGHEVWMRNGVDHEETGRGALRFSAEIPFYNHIFPAKSELWIHAALYPRQYRFFLEAAIIGGKGLLVHPELGPVFCKLKSCKTKYDSTKRGGCMVIAEWVESIDLNDESVNAYVGASSYNASQEASIRSAAESLDAKYTDLSKEIPHLPKRMKSLIDVINAFSAIGDQVQLFAARQAGSLDSLEYASKRLLRSMALDDNVEDMDSKRAAIGMRLAVYELKRDLRERGGKIGTHVTRARTTVCGLANSLHVPVSALVEMNPRIVSKPVIYENTIVRYRKAA